MPIFEYKCLKCGKQFEYLVIPTSPAAACPKCASKGKNLEQLLSMFATTNENVTTKHLKRVRKQSAGIQHEQRMMEQRWGKDD